MVFGDGELRGYLPYVKSRLGTDPQFLALPTDFQQQVAGYFLNSLPSLLRAGVNLRVNL